MTQTKKETTAEWTLSKIHTLVDGHRSTSNGFYLINREYPSGDVEAVALMKRYDEPIKKGGGKRKHNSKAEMSEEALSKSQQRARRTMRRKALSLNADRLLTLTFRENLTDINKAWDYFRQFNRIMTRLHPEKWRYVCVPEYQKRGAVHFHLAISGRWNYNHVRNVWHSVVGTTTVREDGVIKEMPNGNIHIQNPKKNGSNSWNPKKIANYLAKYMSKYETVEFNRRRYSTGGKIPEPIIRRGWLALGVSVKAVMIQIIETLTDKEIENIWESDTQLVYYLST
jgi:hypothetical protein